jgi:hypothetical protein
MKISSKYTRKDDEEPALSTMHLHNDTHHDNPEDDESQTHKVHGKILFLPKIIKGILRSLTLS